MFLLVGMSGISNGYSFSIGRDSSFPEGTLRDTDLASPSFPVCRLVTTPIFHWFRGVLSCMRTTSPIATAFLFNVLFRQV